MSAEPVVQTISSGSEQRMNVPVITVGGFFKLHAKTLQLKLEGEAVGFERRIREPTINRPGLALAGFYTYFAEKRVQVLGAAEHSYLKDLSSAAAAARFRALCAQKIPCLVISRGFHLSPELLAIANGQGIAVFRTPMITMKFINAATIALELDFSPTVTEFGSMVDILGIGVLIRGASGVGKSEAVLGLIERGYSLVADDVTRIKSLEGRELDGDGSGVDPLPHGSARDRDHQRRLDLRDRRDPDREAARSGGDVKGLAGPGRSG